MYQIPFTAVIDTYRSLTTAVLENRVAAVDANEVLRVVTGLPFSATEAFITEWSSLTSGASSRKALLNPLVLRGV